MNSITERKCFLGKGMSDTRQRREVLYSGRVQGVGFRYTTRQLAEDYPVTGFVRNLVDGSVQLVVEGEASDLDAFLDRLGQVMHRYIRSAAVEVVLPTGEFVDFVIRH